MSIFEITLIVILIIDSALVFYCYTTLKNAICDNLERARPKAKCPICRRVVFKHDMEHGMCPNCMELYRACLELGRAAYKNEEDRHDAGEL